MFADFFRQLGIVAPRDVGRVAQHHVKALTAAYGGEPVAGLEAAPVVNAQAVSIDSGDFQRGRAYIRQGDSQLGKPYRQ